MPAVGPDASYYERISRFLSLDGMQTHLHRWRLNLVTGAVKEERLSDTITEFGMINGLHGGRRHRYTYAATGVPGRFQFNGLVKHDVDAGTEQAYMLPDGVYCSETAMAPRVGSTGEDDGYLVTFTIDVPENRSQALVFDARKCPQPGPLPGSRCPSGSAAVPIRRGPRDRLCLDGAGNHSRRRPAERTSPRASARGCLMVGHSQDLTIAASRVAARPFLS
ncbi:MAG: carotenoid oxygenase family protein [Candidatus Nanopelagicales bacterium]